MTSMSRSERRGTVALAVALTLLAVAAGPLAAQDDQPPVIRGGELVEIVTPYVFTGDLRALPKALAWQPGDPIKEIPRRHYDRVPVEPAPRPNGFDPLLDVQAQAPRGTQLAFSTPDLNFDGQGYTGVNPPDTVGDVGAHTTSR